MQVSMQAEHDVLRGIAREFAAILDGPLPEDMTYASKMRIEFSRLFRAHIASEREYAQHCLMGAGKPVRMLVEDHFRRFSQLYFDYSSHVHHWRAEDIRDDWQGYGRAVRALQTRFYEMLEWEEKEVLPALAQAEKDAFLP